MGTPTRRLLPFNRTGGPADKSVVYMGRVDESRQASAGCLRRPLPAVCGGLFRPFAAAFSGRLRRPFPAVCGGLFRPFAAAFAGRLQRPLPAVCGGLLTRAWCTKVLNRNRLAHLTLIFGLLSALVH